MTGTDRRTDVSGKESFWGGHCVKGGHNKNPGERGWAAAAAGPQTQGGLLEAGSLETSRLLGL